MMNSTAIIFYVLAAFTLANALLAVTARKIFRAAIFLLFSLIGVSGLYFWLQFEFLAAVQIMVYVGGITVLIIFSIFLTNQAGDYLPKQQWITVLFSILAASFGFALVSIQVLGHSFIMGSSVPIAPTVANIGELMLGAGKGGFALPFELVSVLLLAAMIGCIVIAIKSKPTSA